MVTDSWHQKKKSFYCLALVVAIAFSMSHREVTHQGEDSSTLNDVWPFG